VIEGGEVLFVRLEATESSSKLRCRRGDMLRRMKRTAMIKMITVLKEGSTAMGISPTICKGESDSQV
jgi:hypothetical protein